MSIDSLGHWAPWGLGGVVAALVVGLIWGWNVYTNWRVQHHGRLTGFEQQADEIVMTFSQPVAHATSQPDTVSVSGSQLTLHLKPHAQAPYPGRLQVRFCRWWGCFDDWLAYTIQPEAWLAKQYGFQRPGGYFVLTDTNQPQQFDAEAFRPIHITDPVLLKSFEPMPAAEPEDPFEYTLALVRALARQPVRVGPINADPAVFRHADTRKKWALLTAGQYSVSCGEWRNLVVELVSAKRGVDRVRALDGYAYPPRFTDMIVEGHSFVEVWSAARHKWLMVDPWFALYLTNAAGQPLSVDEIHTMPVDEVRVAKIMPDRPVFSFAKTGQRQDDTLTLTEPLQGYLRYFRYVTRSAPVAGVAKPEGLVGTVPR
ncbi:MAG: hypothetical protein KC474_04210 [Cyanobacteria bacterium HKST-UBA04]|nr:hypothetical protein [Cyanobacteria bacterium HKST-UBA04]MCA9840522.1 hypothetical protein [Cyanobacteria bacterium HKST-UBA03]